MKSNNNQNGFTLIEVLIAASLLSIGMLAMGSFLGSYMVKNAQNENRTQATMYAQEKLEELITDSLQISLTQAAHGNAIGEALDSDGTVLGAAGTAGEFFRRTWTIVDTTDPKTLTVNVAWVSSTGDFPQVTLTTLINNDAP
jgi:prepilin-type N-terminal cleavage/methylation domain-containing protein